MYLGSPLRQRLPSRSPGRTTSYSWLLQLLILCRGIEARTFLPHPWQVAVAENLCLRIGCFQRAQQGAEALLLCRRPRVGWIAVLVQTALVTHAYRVRIVPGADVRPHHFIWSPLMKLSVVREVVVIAAALPALRSVVVIQPLESERAVAPRGGAVNHNQINLSHRLQSMRPMHDCTKNVETVSVMMVAMYFSTLPMTADLLLMNFNIIVFWIFRSLYDFCRLFLSWS